MIIRISKINYFYPEKVQKHSNARWNLNLRGEMMFSVKSEDYNRDLTGLIFVFTQYWMNDFKYSKEMSIKRLIFMMNLNHFSVRILLFHLG